MHGKYNALTLSQVAPEMAKEINTGGAWRAMLAHPTRMILKTAVDRSIEAASI